MIKYEQKQDSDQQERALAAMLETAKTAISRNNFFSSFFLTEIVDGNSIELEDSTVCAETVERLRSFLLSSPV